MKLVWTRPAAADRREIRAYIAQDNPPAALALDELISEKAARLIDHPQLGRPGRVAGTRELVAHRNYIVVYDVTGDLVRVLPAARRPPPAARRPPPASGHHNRHSHVTLSKQLSGGIRGLCQRGGAWRLSRQAGRFQ